MALSFNRTSIPKMNIGSYNSSSTILNINGTYNMGDYEDYEDYEGEETSVDTNNEPVFEPLSESFEEVSSNKSNIFLDTAATVDASILSGLLRFYKGTFNVMESLIDFGATAATWGSTHTLSAWLSDEIFLALGSDKKWSDYIWDFTKAFASNEFINNGFETLFNNFSWINDNAVWFMQDGNIGCTIAETSGEIAGTLALGKFTEALGWFSKGSKYVAGASGAGNGASDAWNSGATTEGGIVSATLNGLLSFGQWGLGELVSGTKALAVVTNTASGGTGVIADSAIDAATTPASFDEAFEGNGGWDAVGISAVLGGIFSSANEAIKASSFGTTNSSGTTTYSTSSTQLGNINLASASTAISSISTKATDKVTQLYSDLTQKIDLNQAIRDLNKVFKSDTKAALNNNDD